MREWRRSCKQMAEQNKITVAQVVAYLAHRTGDSGENEITNRLTTLPQLREVLASTPLNLDELRRVSAKLWVLFNGQDATRRNAFLGSGAAEDTIAALLNGAAGVEEMARIDTFIYCRSWNTGTRILKGGCLRRGPVRERF